MKKYEVQVLQTMPGYANEKLEKLQNEGWQIAGNIDVSHDRGNIFMYIPLKRELPNLSQSS